MNNAVTSMPLKPATPVAARVLAAGPSRWLAQPGGSLLRALEASGRARAQRHLLDFARSCEATRPELAKELRAACNQGPFA